ncbi:hypothetical protein [Perlabentimonas gracilis]|uniref:hypothetical protein n=1 Tax=Perlabentimonas gracilis TaxID=2715279 RepID=UPI00140BAA19|nr:hypothetical protein [Perlabentimonas gracilis]NHB69264.1 hypothetical protein [Perlabentimonas gracilis]
MIKLNQLQGKTGVLAFTIILLLSVSSCHEELPTKEVIESTPPFKSGIQLSYTQKETSFSTSVSKGERKNIGGVDIQSEDKEVNIFFDTKKENYSIKTKRLDGFKSKRKDFVEPEWKEIVTTNFDVSIYNELGESIFSDLKTEKSQQDLSYLVTPYPERAKLMKEMLEMNSKTSSFAVEVQADSNVVKLTRVFEKDNELDENIANHKAVSYLNLKYGVPVISELFDSKGNLVSKVTMLYRLVDEIPVLAYEEAISYTVDYAGEVIEHKTITNYDNISINNF